MNNAISDASIEAKPEVRLNLLLWAGLLLAPAAWIVELELVYMMANWACLGLPLFSLHIAAGTCLLISLWGLVIAGRNWRASGSRLPSDEQDPVTARVRFMSVLGVMTGALFSLLIVAQWLAVVFLDPCPASF